MSDKSSLICAEVQNEELNLVRIGAKGKLEKWIHEKMAPSSNPVETLLNRIEFHFGKEGIEIPLRIILPLNSQFQSKLIYSSSVNKNDEIKDWFLSQYLGEGSENFISKLSLSEGQNSQAKAIYAGIRKEELAEVGSKFKTWGVKPQWLDLKTVAVSNLLELIEPNVSGIVFQLSEGSHTWYNFVNGTIVAWSDFRIKTNSSLKDAVKSQIEKNDFSNLKIYTLGSACVDSDLEGYFQSLSTQVQKVNSLEGIAEAASITEKEALACSLAYSLFSRGDI